MKNISNRLLLLMAAGIVAVFLLVVYFFLINLNNPQTSKVTRDQENQARADRKSAQKEKELLDEKPWLLKIPPPNDKYFIGYDQEKNEFFISLYSSSTSQTEAYKNEALNALKSIGVETSLYHIEFEVVSK